MGSMFSSQSPFINDPSVYATRVDEKTVPADIHTYDYVIAGGGTAACVLASRLSEDPNVEVLMIEAGKSHLGHLYSRVPGAYVLNFKTGIDWNYMTTKQANVNDRAMRWPAGKVVGGGSMINAMMYQPPCEDDVKEWARLGATGWKWEGDLKKYLTRAEKYTPNARKPNTYASNRGTSGPWQITHTESFPIMEMFLDACERVGIPRIDDVCRPEGPIGAAPVSGWIDSKGERSSIAHAYLSPHVLQRPNLTVAVETTVTRILFSRTPGIPHARGVELAQGPDAPVYQVRSRREVLCCAGAIKTPSLLIHSGIGPKGELKRLGIPIVKELEAVGKNLSDHLIASVNYRTKAASFDSLITPTGSILPMLQWMLTGSGPFASLVGQTFAFTKSTDTRLPYTTAQSKPVEVVDASAGGGSPDLEYIIAPIVYLDHGGISAPPGVNAFCIGPVLLRPRSTGTITPKSASVWDGVDMDPNYFSVESDMDTFVRGFRLALKIGRSKPLVDELIFKDDTEESDSIFYPADADPDQLSDEAIKRYIRRRAETVYHPMCTARIGQSPADSVVNHELRVHGVSGLRVVDASVLPSPFPGHTCATVVAIAEKASDMVKSAQ